MADNLNMSDYRKIIFADNINEQNTTSQDLDLSSQEQYKDMQELSGDYPFVVFFTNQNINGTEIHNIWKAGARLTRFVGIDPNANKIQVGDHTLKLNFDYTTGLLSVVDCNQLEKIELYKVIYKARNNESIELNGVSLQNVLVDAKDNKFTLIFKFTLKDNDTNNSDTNVNNISKQLNILSDHFTIGTAYKYTNGVSNSNQIGYYAYDCIVKSDTEILSGNQYTFTSAYDSTISTRIDNLKLRLNPTDIDIFYNNTKINNTTIALYANDEYIFNAIINPSDALTTVGGKELTLNIDINNTLCAVTSENGVNINSSNIPFRIQTLNPTGNKNSSTITLSIHNDGGATGIEDEYVISKFTVYIGGGNVYFYCGYTKPTDTELFKSQMNNIDINNIGKVLYDWQNNDWNISDDSTQDFYVAFTEGYEDRIKICWDGYTIINNNIKKYVEIPNNTRFIKQTNDHPTGITVYKASIKGKFYGKIQIQ